MDLAASNYSPEGYWEEAENTYENDILLIADEVMTGFEESE